MIGRPPFGCAAMGWLETRRADAVTNATARDAGISKRDAGIARPALLGLSRPNIRNPVFAALLQLAVVSPQISQARRWGNRTPDHASRSRRVELSLQIAATAMRTILLQPLKKLHTT